MKIGKIYLKQKNKRLDRTYDYLIPDNIRPGQRVLVPFGKGNRVLEGFITSVKKDSGFREDLKEIIEVLDKEPILDSHQIQLLLYLHQNNFKRFYDNLGHFTSFVKVKKRKEAFENTVFHLKNYKKLNGAIQKAVLEALSEDDLSFTELKAVVPKVTKKTIERLEELDLIECVVLEEPKALDISFYNEPEHLGQEKFYQRIHGSKELYEEINSLISNTGQTLIIFPDNFSAFLFKSLNKFKQKEVLYNSYLKNNQKQEIFNEVKDGSIRVVIGSNAALFLPYNNLKNVIVVNVGDEAYIATKEIAYNTLECAEKLSEIWDANFYALDIIDSTISSKKVVEKEWRAVEADDFRNLDIEIININEIPFEETPVEEEAISSILETSIRESLEHHEKSILFINRKGYYNNHFCSNCGEPIYCPRCNSVLQSRKSGKEVVCRVCGFEGTFPNQCPSCGNEEFVLRHFGIDKTLEEAEEKFPNAKIDAFFYGHKPNLKDVDIIVATKALMYTEPLENVTTVGALLADLDINFPDYNSSESSVRLYYDLFNRYSDARKFVQTHVPNKQHIFEAIRGNTLDFLYDLSHSRVALRLPPYGDLYIFTLSAENSKIATKESRILHDRINARNKENKFEILPIYSVREKKGYSQRRFIVKADKDSNFKQFIDQMYRDGEIEALQSDVSIIVNPAQIL